MLNCPLCSAELLSDDALQDHVLKVHKKQKVDEIQYQCTLCTKKWANFETLRKHQQTCVGPCEGPSSSKFDDKASTTSCHPPPMSEDEVSSSAHDNDEVDADPTDDNHCEDAAYSVEEALQSDVVDMLSQLKDAHATERIINIVISGVNKIMERALAVVGNLMRDKAGEAEILSVPEVLEVLDDVSGMSVFEGVDSEDEILDYLKQHGGYVEPVMVPFLAQPELLNQQIVKKDIEFFYKVPFLPQLQELLRCSDVLHCVDNPKEPEEWTYESILDGLIYKCHPVVLKFGNTTLSIYIYHDGVEPSDLGSARVGKHNLTFFYWNLGNIYPEFRSSDKVVQLYVICKTPDLKKYGYKKIMEDFIEGINKLSSDEGVTFNIDGQNRIFHGFLHCCLGDYPAQGAIGGFKESVSAEKPCRECMASNEEGYIKATSISNIQLRNKNLHESHLQELDKYNALSSKEKLKRRDPSVEYGVNNRSVLLDIKYFDVTKQLPQDLMHDVNEGILEYTCRLVLRHVILDKKALPISLVNERIASLSKAFESDRPGVILEDHLGPTKHLRQSSAQMRTLSLLLPFVLQKETADGSMVFSGDQEYLDCLICVLQFLQVSSAFKFHITDVEVLRKKIEELRAMILALDDEINMGKLHFLHHLCDGIALFGVLRQVACFRCEGHHAFFKRLLKILHNEV